MSLLICNIGVGVVPESHGRNQGAWHTSLKTIDLELCGETYRAIVMEVYVHTGRLTTIESLLSRSLWSKGMSFLQSTSHGVPATDLIGGLYYLRQGFFGGKANQESWGITLLTTMHFDSWRRVATDPLCDKFPLWKWSLLPGSGNTSPTNAIFQHDLVNFPFISQVFNQGILMDSVAKGLLQSWWN